MNKSCIIVAQAISYNGNALNKPLYIPTKQEPVGIIIGSWTARDPEMTAWIIARIDVNMYSNTQRTIEVDPNSGKYVLHTTPL